MNEKTPKQVVNPSAQSSSFISFTPQHLGLATFALCLTSFMQILDTTIANVSLPTIAGNLGVSTSQGTWVITSFAVCTAITLPLTGFLSRRYGEVILFAICTLLFALTSFLCGIATSMPELIAFRALQGAVAGPMYPLSQSLLVAIYPREKRSMALAIFSMVSVVAPIAGPLLGGWITSDYSWEWIFFINVPIGIIACVIVYSQLRNMPKVTVKVAVDYVGLLLLILAVGALQILLDLGNDEDWFNSNLIIICGIVALIGGIVFLIWELTEVNPIVDLTLFKYRNFAIATACLVLGFAAFFANGLLIPLWLQRTMGYDSMWAGLVSAPVGILPIFLAPLIGKYAHRLDLRMLVTISFLVMGLTAYWRSGFNTDTDAMHVALTTFVQGLGVACFFMPLLTILLSELHPTEIANGSGLQSFLRVLGGSFAASISVFMWDELGIIQHANLNESISAYSPLTQQAIQQFGGDQQTSLAVLNQIVTQQASQIAFNDISYALSWIFFGLMFLIWFSKPPFFGRAHSK